MCSPLLPFLDKISIIKISFFNDGFWLQDPSESLVVIGRYISENYDGVALHPIDFIDISTGQLVAEVMDPNITTISPVNKLHPRDDVLASGSSRFGLYSPCYKRWRTFFNTSIMEWFCLKRRIFPKFLEFYCFERSSVSRCSKVRL